MRPDLLDRAFEHDELAMLDVAERRLALRTLFADDVPEADLAAAVDDVAREIDGFGPLTPLFEDPLVSDILVNGPDEVWVERAGRLVTTDVRFAAPEHLRAWTERMLGRAGARADASSPVADAALRDGSRIHVVMPPIARGGPVVSIRRFVMKRPSLESLVERRTMSADEASVLSAAVAEGASVVIAGATGTGKTTLLNALLTLVPSDERVVIVEETPELDVSGRHVVALTARPPNVEGAGAVPPDQLVRAALRMRPDRIVVGEVRGPEALVALAAMSTGHRGSMLTVHARSAHGALDRLTSLALEAASAAAETSLRQRFAQTVDLIVHLERAGSERRVSEIAWCD